MPALLDTLDRFNYASSSIRSLTNDKSHNNELGPFTAAMLQLTPQDFLRDADDSEYGIFTFVRDSSYLPSEGAAGQGKVGRKEFRGATPLRGKRTAATREEEPEVYLEAALKYMDRFHAVKPMPHTRARVDSLIDRLNSARDNIEKLQASLEEFTNHGRTSPKSQIAEEERRISELKSRILQLRQRKEALTATLPAKPKRSAREAKSIPKPSIRRVTTKPKAPSPSATSDSPSSALSTPVSDQGRGNSKANARPVPTTQRVAGPPPGKSLPREDEDEGERLFWSGKKPSRFALGKATRSESLLDEELDMSGLGALASPPPPLPSSNRLLNNLETVASEDKSFTDEPDSVDGRSVDGRSVDDRDDSGEPTIVLSKIQQPVSAPTPPSPPPSRPTSRVSVPGIQTPVQKDKDAASTVPLSSTKKKVRRIRITAEVERICSKIWSTIPSLLVPGSDFQLPGKKPPNAEDTITVLRAISTQPIPEPNADLLASPSTRSTLSSILGVEPLGLTGGSPHQILTARVLLSLLTAPNHAMPLVALKAELAAKSAVTSPGPEAGREAKQSAAAQGASAAQAGTRALYGCVAKRLVKIDRSGGEQVVKFD